MSLYITLKGVQCCKFFLYDCIHTDTVNTVRTKNTLNDDGHGTQKALLYLIAEHLNLEPFVVSWTVEVSCAAPAFLDT
jgi:hypothetical protein